MKDRLRHHLAVRELPTGTVTFLFTDIEGSTRLLHELGADAYASRLAEHRRVLRAAFVRHDGVEVNASPCVSTSTPSCRPNAAPSTRASPPRRACRPPASSCART